MPFWTFWNYDKALKILAESTQQSIETVCIDIELKIPVLNTWDYEKAVQIKNELLKVNCDLEIKEMKFVCNDEEEVNQIKAQIIFSQDFGKLLKDLPSDVNAARTLVIDRLEKKRGKDSKE